MSPQEQDETKPLERIYQEASQWVRLVNTIIWSMGTLLVPVSFGLLGVALNKSVGFELNGRGKIVLGIGSVFLFGFWVYASRIYKESVQVARDVLIEIEKKWVTEGSVNVTMSLYQKQQSILDQQFKQIRFRKKKIPYDLFMSQKITLVALIAVWILIVGWRL